MAAESGPRFTVYQRDGERLALRKPDGPDLDLAYVGLARWTSDDPLTGENSPGQGFVQTDIRGETVFGYPTGLAGLPNTGRAAYRLEAYGGLSETTLDGAGYVTRVSDVTGEGSLEASFATGLVQASLRLDKTDPLGVTSVWDSLAGSGAVGLDPTGRPGFTGELTSERYADGHVPFSGDFFGPQAQELAGRLTYGRSELLPVDPNNPQQPPVLSSDTLLGAVFLGSTAAPGTRAAPNPSLADLRNNEHFPGWSVTMSRGVVGGGPSSGPVAWAEPSPSLVLYDAATDQFTFPGARLTPDLVVSSSASETVYAPADDVRLTLFKPGASPLALDYAALASWEYLDPDDLPISGHTAYGQLTPARDFPTLGTATYDLAATGVYWSDGTMRPLTGTGALTADFRAVFNSVDVRLDLAFADGAGPTPWRSFTNSPDPAFSFLSASDSELSAPIRATDDPAIIGEIHGNFYGPGAAEVGGVFSIPRYSADFHEEGASGAFVGEKAP